MTQRIADDFSYIANRLKEIESKAPPKPGKVAQSIPTPPAPPSKTLASNPGHSHSHTHSFSTVCPMCQGHGIIVTHKGTHSCPNCHGGGTITV